jgi:hypothetical protein
MKMCLRKKNNKTLLETVKTKKYKTIESDVYKNYLKYLNEKLGTFLKSLKDNGDTFYKKFLNENGDSTYLEFKLIDGKFSSKKGLYTYYIDGKLKYIGKTEKSFKIRINNGYGKISPKNCYLDGQSTNCHINSLITESRNCKQEINLFLLTLDNDELIAKLEKELIKKYSPEWNIKLN